MKIVSSPPDDWSPSLNLEAVYATITYYWRNREQVDAYLQAWKEHGERMRREQERNPPPAVQRLRTMIRQRQLESHPYPALD